MKGKLIAIILVIAVGAAAGPACAEKATMQGKDLTRHGEAITMKNFDVTLDGRLLTANTAVYHTDTGIVDLSGNVRLRFGPQAKTFPHEVHSK
jgi:hypothetical protein